MPCALPAVRRTHDGSQSPEYGKLSQGCAGCAKRNREHDRAGIAYRGAYANRFCTPASGCVVVQQCQYIGLTGAQRETQTGGGCGHRQRLLHEREQDVAGRGC